MVRIAAVSVTKRFGIVYLSLIIPAFAFDDVQLDFRARIEASDALSITEAWRALLANAERGVVRRHVPSTADDYLEFGVTRTEEGKVGVSLERRLAKFVDGNEGDYAGTLVLGCYFAVVLDQEEAEDPGPWSAEGYVSAYDALEDEDDRPDLAAFRDEVEASAAFRTLRRARVTARRIAIHPG
jgi:hypothetical protein